MNCDQVRKQFKIEDVMRMIDADEKKATANRSEIFYLSPFRSEKTASFKIDTDKNTWFDHGGAGEGGDVIRLIQRHLGGQSLSSVSEALQWFRSRSGAGALPEQPKRCLTVDPARNEKASKPKDEPKFVLVKEKLITHPALVNYVINERRLPINLVRKHCKEIHFQLEKAPKFQKPLFGFGMLNDAGAWEVRSAIGDFKAAVNGNKYLTTRYGCKTGNPEILDVMEGNPDFLTKELLWPMKGNEAIIILNGAKLIRKAAEKIKTEPRLQAVQLVRFWTQNDNTGKQILSIFRDELQDRMRIVCMGENYIDCDGDNSTEYKDLNKWWTDSPMAQFITPGKVKPIKVGYDTAWNGLQQSRQNLHLNKGL